MLKQTIDVSEDFNDPLFPYRLLADSTSRTEQLPPVRFGALAFGAAFDVRAKSEKTIQRRVNRAFHTFHVLRV